MRAPIDRDGSRPNPAPVQPRTGVALSLDCLAISPTVSAQPSPLQAGHRPVCKAGASRVLGETRLGDGDSQLALTLIGLQKKSTSTVVPIVN